MISATAILTPSTAKSMSNADKKSLAIKAMTEEQTISSLANHYQVSRQFVSNQKQKIMSAVNDAFNEEVDDNKVLYNIPGFCRNFKDSLLKFPS